MLSWTFGRRVRIKFVSSFKRLSLAAQRRRTIELQRSMTLEKAAGQATAVGETETQAEIATQAEGAANAMTALVAAAVQAHATAIGRIKAEKSAAEKSDPPVSTEKKDSKPPTTTYHFDIRKRPDSSVVVSFGSSLYPGEINCVGTSIIDALRSLYRRATRDEFAVIKSVAIDLKVFLNWLGDS